MVVKEQPMRPFLPLFLLLLLAACAPALTSCGGDAEEEKLHIIGTVIFVPLEGGFFGIRSEDGKPYDPINLPTDFQRDGLQVEAVAIPRLDMVSFHQWGQLIEIEEIKELSRP
jgi:hypothetical protein